MKTTDKPRGKPAKAASRRSARFTRTALFPVIALPLMLCVASCKTVSAPQTPRLEANLSQPCPPLPDPPVVLIDPDRAVWEAELIAFYGDCAARHFRAVAARG